MRWPRTSQVLMLIAILGVALTLNVGIAKPPSTGPYYLTGPPFSDSTYVFGVFSNEATYFGLKGSTWEVTYSTNITMLVESAFDTFSDGGRFVFQAGTYDFSMLTLTGGLSPPSNSIVEGEGDATIIDLGTWQYQVFYIDSKENVTIRNLRFQRETDVGLGYADITVVDSNNILIENNVFKSQGGNYGTGIQVIGSCDILRIQNNNIHNRLRYGVIIRGDTSKPVSNVWITENYLADVGRHGIYLSSQNLTQHIHINENTIINFGSNTTGSVGIGLKNYPASSGCIEDVEVHDNIIVSEGNEQSSCSGISISGDGNGTYRDISITDNHVYGTSSLAWGIGIETLPHGSYFENVSICDNMVLSCQGGIRFGDANNGKVSGNIVNHPTEWGIATYQVAGPLIISDNLVQNWGSGGTGNLYGMHIVQTNNTLVTINHVVAVDSETCIRLTTHSDNTTVSGNKLSTSGVGIHINTATCDDTLIKFNDFRGCVTPISDSGTGTIKQYNEGYDTENRGTELDAAYIISSDGAGTYYMESGMQGDDSEEVVTSTDADVIINWALGNLTSGRDWQETVFLKGNFTINSPLIVYNFTHLILDGRIYLEDGSDCNILQNAHPTTYDIAVTIEGGEWHGNHDGQSSGNGIYWEHSTQPGGTKPFKTVTFKDMTIVECQEDGIHVNFEDSSTSELVIEDPVSKWHMDDGIHLCCCADWKIEGGMPLDGAGYGLHIEASGFASVSNSYINDGVLIEGIDHGGWVAGVQLLTMTNCELDCAGHHGIQLKAVEYSTFTNLVFHLMDDGASDYDGIRLESVGNPALNWATSSNNTFTNINFGYSSGTRQWKYGIHEVDANQTQNIYSVINARNTATMGICINGSASHVCCSWNGTNWIDNYP